MNDRAAPPPPHTPFESAIDDEVRASERYQTNKQAVLEKLVNLRTVVNETRQGGGPRRIEAQHKKGRLTARERIARLIDEGTEFRELGIHAANGMYDGKAPAAGVITGLARVAGRLFMVIANDATVASGAFFPMTAKKVIRNQNISLQCHLPTIYLVDSAGVNLPMQDEVFPDQDDFGRVFRNNAVLSAQGTPQIAAIMGMCVAGGAYLPIMCDTVLMTEGSGLFLAGPDLVAKAVGKKFDAEEIGGAELHAAISGTIDFREKDDEACIERIRALAGTLAPAATPPFRRDEPQEPKLDSEDLVAIVPADPLQQYDVREVIARIVDDSAFTEYKPEYGKTLVCAFARVDGWSVGIIANQKTHVRDPGKPWEMGGVIYSGSAEKAARFILDCNQNKIPLIFLHDVNGFMVGPDSEKHGIIRAGAKMVNAVSNSVVPKISVIMGGSFGAGHYAMCGKAYDPNFIVAWPEARYCVMGAEQAAGTITQVRAAAMKRKGESVDEAELEEFFQHVREKYEQETDPIYAAARLWIDKIIDPRDTRAFLADALEACANKTELDPFRVGVLQT
ncbi:MAG: acyl-CoA carboxylase subunit beta [Planctomycetota bacterium]|jgi:acetyl-CoA carboxylase carboxyltransferase component